MGPIGRAKTITREKREERMAIAIHFWRGQQERKKKKLGKRNLAKREKLRKVRGKKKGDKGKSFQRPGGERECNSRKGGK